MSRAPPRRSKIPLLNPVEAAIRDFEESRRVKTDDFTACPAEHKPLIAQCPAEDEPFITLSIRSDNSDNTTTAATQNALIVRQKFGVFIWFAVIVLTYSSWFTFTTGLPVIASYYNNASLIKVSLLFSLAPAIFFAMSPVIHKLLVMRTDPTLPLVLSAFLNAVGAGITFHATGKDGFIILLIGQMFVFVSAALTPAFPLSAMHSKLMNDSRNNCIVYVGLTAFLLGSVSGVMLPTIAVCFRLDVDETGRAIPKLLLWKAVISGVIFALVPFALKERKREQDNASQQYHSNDDYDGDDRQALVVVLETATPETPTTNSVVNNDQYEELSFLQLFLVTIRDRKNLFLFIKIAIGYSLFVSMFTMGSILLCNQANDVCKYSGISESCTLAADKPGLSSFSDLIVANVFLQLMASQCATKDLEFNVYHFRRKSRWGKAVKRAERKCREDTCKLFRGLTEEICIRKCMSPACHKEIYAWNELEEGERDIRWSSFKGCAAEQLRKQEDNF
eukprot:gene7852-8701_t